MHKNGLIALFLLFSLHFSSLSGAQVLCSVRDRALNYLLNHQVKESGDIYKRGEWYSQITTGGFPLASGLLKEGPFEDPNVFNTATIQNILAEIYFKYQKDPRIPGALSMAKESMRRYKTENNSYDFWPKDLRGGEDGHLPRFQLTIQLISGLLNIPADADDTAVVYLSQYYDQKLNPNHPLAKGIDKLFTNFRDNGVRLPAPSNMIRGEIGTGAYMTWLQHEPLIPVFGSIIFRQSAGPRISLGKNDVDCVVNANVLRTLQIYGKNKAAGFASACSLLNANAEDEDFNTCGNYYPDTFWFHFAVARAFQDGVSCLEPAVKTNLRHILNTQQADGRWRNQVLDGDDILATALALSTLIKTADLADAKNVEAVRNGLHYLTAFTQIDSADEAYWPEGVFFSAGVPARKDVLWFSRAFTTAIVLQILFEGQVWLPDELSCPQ